MGDLICSILKRCDYMNKVEKISIKKIIKESQHLIENWLDYYVYKEEIPGLTVGLFVEDETLIKREFGYSDLKSREKLDENHLFRIASHSKLFTATAIMILYNRDLISLDNRVIDLLPWFNSLSEPNRKNIRIRHLMSHASGITRDGEYGQWFTNNFPDEEEFIKEFQKDISFFSTNQQLKYSNFAVTLLGLIIEKVSGSSYSDFIQKEIFDKLGMINSVVDVNESNIKMHCSGHTMKFPKESRDKFDHIPAKVMSPATGLSSNVEDLIKFYRAHLLGNDILFPDHIKREMQTVKSISDDSIVRFGLGFRMNKMGKSLILGHGGGYPGFITFSGMIQDKKMIIVILTNAIDTEPSMIALGLLNLIDKFIQSKAELFDDIKDKPDYSHVTGFYSSVWHVGLYSQIGNRLVSIAPGLINPSESMQIYTGEGDLKFKIPNVFPFGSPGEFFKFDISDKDNVFISMSGGKSTKFDFNY